MSQKLIAYYKGNDNIQDEEKGCIAYLKKKWLINTKQLLFLSSFVNKYSKIKVDIQLCDRTKMYYINHNNHRLYWQRGFDKKTIADKYRSLLLEQDANSPHRYWTDKQHLHGKKLFDIGAAEGIVTLNHIDSLEKSYLFECDPSWIEALNETFRPFMDKVVIVNKYISDITDPATNTISIDDFVLQTGCQFDVLKMDIEGYEERAIHGADRTLTNGNIECAICTYHKGTTEEVIKSMLNKYGYTYSFAKGRMYYFYDNNPPYMRHGVMRATKQQ